MRSNPRIRVLNASALLAMSVPCPSKRRSAVEGILNKGDAKILSQTIYLRNTGTFDVLTKISSRSLADVKPSRYPNHLKVYEIDQTLSDYS